MVFCDIGVEFGLCLAGPAEGAELSGQRVGPSLTIANLSLGTPRISDLAFIDLLVTNRARHRNLVGFVFNADDALKVSKAAQASRRRGCLRRAQWPRGQGGSWSVSEPAGAGL